MKCLSQTEIDNIAKSFIEYRIQAMDSHCPKEKQYLAYQQNQCIEGLRFLVIQKTKKYQKFSNYLDLEQDGFEALLLALKTYNPNKGCFNWWANKYIGTRVSRAANAHSTIRFPLKQARETKPYKVTTIPIMTDLTPGAEESLEKFEQQRHVIQAIKRLPKTHQKVINLIYGFNGSKQCSLASVVKELTLSKNQCARLLQEAKIQLKEILQSSSPEII